MKRYFFLFASLVSCFYNMQLFASYTLGDILQSSPQIASHTPSFFIAPVTGQCVILKGHVYQIRLFSYEINEESLKEKAPSYKNKKFADFIKENDQMNAVPKPGPETINPVYYFSASTEMKESGINYLLSLREIPKTLNEKYNPCQKEASQNSS
ncbi:MAG: hypothetical protein ACTHJ4_05155 [Candidatus Nucleicultricaceae bacterium]